MKLQVGVKALIKNSSNQFLFIRRAVTFGEEKQPHWDIPGGRINADEPLLDALRREIMEETGLQCESTPTLLAAQDIFASRIDLHVVRLTYLIEGTGDPNLSDEHQEAKWMTIEEVLTENPDPYIREVLESQKNL
ncbi:MAG TPA: NUDIX hydrolase [Candidatus Saccharimonadales bacterium]|nr:NUDIX hydrolase [Candidatus Saccharimonadales bacterium]